MGTTLNRKTYAKLIDENIAEIEKHMPDSLERRHTIDVLKWSINALYDTPPQKDRSVELLKTLALSEKIVLIDGGYYFKEDIDGDHELSEEQVYEILLRETNQ